MGSNRVFVRIGRTAQQAVLMALRRWAGSPSRFAVGDGQRPLDLDGLAVQCHPPGLVLATVRLAFRAASPGDRVMGRPIGSRPGHPARSVAREHASSAGMLGGVKVGFAKKPTAFKPLTPPARAVGRLIGGAEGEPFRTTRPDPLCRPGRDPFGRSMTDRSPVVQISTGRRRLISSSLLRASSLPNTPTRPLGEPQIMPSSSCASRRTTRHASATSPPARMSQSGPSNASSPSSKRRATCVTCELAAGTSMRSSTRCRFATRRCKA